MIVYAFDSKDPDRKKLVPAQDAVPGKPYYCPFCGVSVRICKYANKRPFFRVLPNVQHLSAACGKIDADDIIVRDIDLLDPDAFIQRLMRMLQKKGGTSNRKRSSNNHSENSDVDHELSPSSLDQLYGAGIDKLDPNTPIKGGKKVSDVLITFNHYHTALEGHPILGRRALELRPECAYNGMIKFVCYWTRRNGEKVRRYFELIIPDQCLYQKAVMDLFDVEGPFMCKKFYNMAKYKLAVVAAEWEPVSEQECHQYCTMCKDPGKYLCLGAMRGYLYNMRQIYCPDIPNNHIED